MSRHPGLNAALCLLLITAGCGTRPPAAPAGGVTVEDCGVQVHVDRAPERAVALDQESTETLLALGLGDRVAGTALPLAPVAEQYRAAYDRIPVLNPKELTGEQLRAADPDFAISAVGVDFTRERVGTRDELAALGVTSYVSAADCPADPPVRTPFERLFTDYENLGKVFDVPDRAADLIAEQRAAIAEAGRVGAARASRPTVAYLYAVYNGTPYVAGGSGIPADMSRILGVTNVFDDIDTAWPEVSWDQLAARNPSVIVLADLPYRGETGDSAEEKIAMMRTHPVLGNLDAVRAGRFVTVPGLELDPTVRSVNALGLVGDALAKLG